MTGCQYCAILCPKSPAHSTGQGHAYFFPFPYTLWGERCPSSASCPRVLKCWGFFCHHTSAPLAVTVIWTGGSCPPQLGNGLGSPWTEASLPRANGASGWELARALDLPVNKPRLISFCDHGLLGLLILDTQINNAPADIGWFWNQEINIHLVLYLGVLCPSHILRQSENDDVASSNCLKSQIASWGVWAQGRQHEYLVASDFLFQESTEYLIGQESVAWVIVNTKCGLKQVMSSRLNLGFGGCKM